MTGATGEDRISILLIEDDPDDVFLIQEMLREGAPRGYEVRHASRLAEGMEIVRANSVDVLLLDLTLPDSTGLDTLRCAAAQAPDLAIVMMTGLNDEPTALEALRQGAQDYLVKGAVDGRALWRAIRYALERRRFEVELRRSEERNRRLIAASPDGIVTVSLEGVVTFASQRAFSMFGYGPEAIAAGHSFLEAVAPTELKRIQANWLALISGQPPVGRSYEFVRADGSRFWGEARSTLLSDADGVIMSIRDVTEKVQAERALLESEQRYRTLVEMADDCIVLTDTEGQLIVGNSALYTSLGFSVGDPEGRDWEARVHPEDAALVGSHLANVLELGSATFEYRVRHKDGHWVYRQARAKLLRDEAQQPQTILTVVEDVTARKAVEQELAEHRAHLEDLVQARTGELEESRAAAVGLLQVGNEQRQRAEVVSAELAGASAALSASERQLRLILDTSDLGIMYIAPDGTIRNTNRQLSAVLRHGPGSYEVGANVFASTQMEPVLQILRTAIGGEPAEFEGQMPEEGTAGRYLRLYCSPAEPGVSPTHIVVTVEDVTDHWLMNEQLRLARNEAEQANRAKGAFLASMSHELRTPLNAIELI